MFAAEAGAGCAHRAHGAPRFAELVPGAAGAGAGGGDAHRRGLPRDVVHAHDVGAEPDGDGVRRRRRFLAIADGQSVCRLAHLGEEPLPGGADDDGAAERAQRIEVREQRDVVLGLLGEAEPGSIQMRSAAIPARRAASMRAASSSRTSATTSA